MIHSKIPASATRTLSRPMSIPEVAVLLGMAPSPTWSPGSRRLLRYLHAAEGSTDQRILVRPGSSGRYTVTLAALRKACPELFDATQAEAIDTSVVAARAFFQDVQDQLDEAKDEIKSLRAQVVELHEMLELSHSRLSKRIKAVEGK